MSYGFLGKLSLINYRIAIHEGDANRRLASQSVEIAFKLFPSEVPLQYKKEFNKFLSCINKTLDTVAESCFHPVKILGIRNSTASKYIKLLIEIEDCLKEISTV